jgi:hypothetical protein
LPKSIRYNSFSIVGPKQQIFVLVTAWSVRMAKRMVLMLVVMLALVGGLGFAKFKQVEAAIAQGKAYQPPPLQ